MDMQVPRINKILTMDPTEGITVQGWVRTKRDAKNFVFLEINDGSSLKGLQVVVDKESEELSDTLNGITTGAAIEVRGNLVESLGQGQRVELQGKEVILHGDSPQDYPLQKKRHSFEFLREIAHLRPRTNTIGAVARVRSALSFAVHSFFNERGFVYVHTPIITASDAEGAGEMFQVTTLPLDNPPKRKDGSIDYSKDFFNRQAHLSVSGQLNGEAYAQAMKHIYTFGPTFRAENSNTTRHLAEFWMIEPEMAFCDLAQNMKWAEEFLVYIFQYVLDKCPDDMEFFNQWIEKGVIEKLQKVISTPFGHITYTDAIKEMEKAKVNFEFAPSWGIDLQTEHERFLSEQLFGGPVIVTDYPKNIKAFYMKLNDDRETVRGMDVLVPRLGEIIGGSEREARYDVLVDRMKECGIVPEDYQWYLDLRKYGSTPHAGFGLGFARALLYITGVQNIREAIPFPRHAGKADF